MSWKEFLKPDWKKISLFVLIWAIPFFAFISLFPSYGYVEECLLESIELGYLANPSPSCNIYVAIFSYVFPSSIVGLHPLLSPILYYLISCSLVWLRERRFIEERMKWKRLEEKYGVKRKITKTVILLIFLILLVISSFLFFGQKKCEKNVRAMEMVVSKPNQISLPSRLNDSLSTICSYSESHPRSNMSTFRLYSCDLNKVKSGLDAPETLSLNEIETYIRISTVYGINGGYSLLKSLYEEEPLWDCDVSSFLYSAMFISSQGIVYMHQIGYMYGCLNEKNFTDSEKKECLISLLDAEKSAVENYSKLSYEGDMDVCRKIGGLSSSIGIRSNCQKMIDYRKELSERIKKSNLDYNQKYILLAGLYIQNMYLGEKAFDTYTLDRILIERITNPKYQALFSPYLQGK